MRGQWLGTYAVTNSGSAIVDIDEVGGRFRGYAYMYDSNVGLPSTRAHIDVPIPQGSALQARLPLQPINPETGDPTMWAALAYSYAASTQFPDYADVQISWTPTTLNVSWTTNTGTNGSMALPATRAGFASTYNPELTVTSWKEFKRFADELRAGPIYLSRSGRC